MINFPDDAYISAHCGLTKCRYCGRDNQEVREGCCFDCATRGEERAAKRTVIQHVAQAWRSFRRGSKNWRYDLKWARERLLRTGDYRTGGYFDGEGIDWRSPAPTIPEAKEGGK